MFAFCANLAFQNTYSGFKVFLCITKYAETETLFVSFRGILDDVIEIWVQIPRNRRKICLIFFHTFSQPKATQCNCMVV